MNLPVTPRWSCSRRGDCCREVGWIVMTPAERQHLEAAGVAPQRPAYWATRPDGRVGLHGQETLTCPYFDTEAVACTVHAVRPYNCRRFLCFRVGDEPYLHGGPLGSLNLSVRLGQSRAARRQYARNQRKAQRWARAHGWSDDAAV